MRVFRFNQAIELAGETMRNVKFIKEKKLIGGFFDEIAQDTGKFSFSHNYFANDDQDGNTQNGNL